MSRAAAVPDVFNAVAEPRRRELLDVLRGGESSVGALVERLDLPQPQVSKHLRVLRDVGAVSVRGDGRRRLYRVEPSALAPIRDWVAAYERHWNERLDLLDEVVGELQGEER